VRRSRRGSSGPPRRWGAPAFLVGLVLAGLVAVPGAAAEGAADCRERFVRDYEAPLREMPGLRPPPQGELPFGPRNFGIHRIERSPIALQGANFGYRFGGKNGGYRVLDLGWHVKATFRSVSPDGRVRRLLGVKEWRERRVKDLDPLQLSLPAEHPGFFRVDLRFERLDGRRLGSYRDYFRVLRRSTDVGLGVEGMSFHPGESVYARIVNAGAGWIRTKGEFGVQREEGGTWVDVPRAPTAESVRRITTLIAPGEYGNCHRYDLPADAAPGRYRFSARAFVVNELKMRTVTAPFEVSP
jgi:hypothetical protein